MQLYRWTSTWSVCCFGMQVIGFFVELVLAVYGFLSNLRECFAINNVVFVSSAVIFSSFIMVICNTAQCATEEVGILLVRVSLSRVGVSNVCLMQCWMGDDDYVDDCNYSRNFMESAGRSVFYRNKILAWRCRQQVSTKC